MTRAFFLLLSLGLMGCAARQPAPRAAPSASPDAAVEGLIARASTSGSADDWRAVADVALGNGQRTLAVHAMREYLRRAPRASDRRHLNRAIHALAEHPPLLQRFDAPGGGRLDIASRHLLVGFDRPEQSPRNDLGLPK